MKQTYIRLSFVVLAQLAILSEQAYCQRDTTKLNQDVEVVKPYRPSISNANKLNLLPVIDDTTRFTPEFKYSIESRPVTSGFTSGPITAAEIKGQQDKNLGFGYLKLGAGVYNTTYGEFFFNNPKSQNGTFGLHFRHLASQGTIKLSEGDLVDAPYSQNNGEIFGSRVIGGSTLSARVSYQRDVVRFYGYPDTIPFNISSLQASAPYFGSRQQFQKTEIQVGLKSNEGLRSIFNYKSGIRYHYFDTKTGQQENAGGFFADFDYEFDKFRGFIESSFDHFTTNGISLSQNPPGNKQSSWLKISPSVLFSGDNWSLQGGVNFYSVADNQGGNISKLYPKINFNFIPVEKIMTLYAGVDGYLQNCNYSTIAYENNWVDPKHNVINADHQYILFGGLKGKITSQISYNVGAKYSSVKDMHFYVLRSTNFPSPFIYNNAFDLIYDNAGILNMSAEISYVNGKDYFLLFKGNYYNYTLENLEFAPHLPNFTIDATAGFRIIDKLTGFSDIVVTGQRKALIQYSPLAVPNMEAVTLNTVLRINLGAEYTLHDNFKIFGRIDNLLNQHYDQWLGYTSQGLRLIAGITYSF